MCDFNFSVHFRLLSCCCKKETHVTASIHLGYLCFPIHVYLVLSYLVAFLLLSGTCLLCPFFGTCFCLATGLLPVAVMFFSKTYLVVSDDFSQKLYFLTNHLTRVHNNDQGYGKDK